MIALHSFGKRYLELEGTEKLVQERESLRQRKNLKFPLSLTGKNCDGSSNTSQ